VPCAVGTQLVVAFVAMSYSSLRPSEAYNHHTESLRISRYQELRTKVRIRWPDSPLPWRSKTARLRGRCPGRRALGGIGGLLVNMAATTLGVYCRLCVGANSPDSIVKPIICFTDLGFLVAWKPVVAPKLLHLRPQSLQTRARHTLVLKAGAQPSHPS
jgi:hypothetical protein